MLAYVTGSGVNLLLFVIAWFTFGLKAFALFDASLRRTEAFPAAGKQTKVLWLALLAATFVVALLIGYPLNLLNIAGDIVAIIYLVDVRPAIRSLGGAAGSLMFFGRGNGGRGRGGGNNGATGW